MNLEDFFKSVGGDYETGITRLPGESLIKKFLGKFLYDPSFSSLKSAFEKGDVEGAFLAAHTLKGTAANLGLDDLANSASDLTELLRGAEKLCDEKYLKATEQTYEVAAAQIKLLEI